MPYSAPSSVALYSSSPRFNRMTMLDFLPADHVPDVLMAAAGDGARVRKENLFHEIGKSARPVGCPVLLRKGNQTFYKVAVAFTLFRSVRHIVPPRKMPSPAVFK